MDEPINRELCLTRDAMRNLGYRAVDMLVEHFVSLERKPVTRHHSSERCRADWHSAMPQSATDPMEVLGQLERQVFTGMMHTDHQRFFAFVPSPSNFVAVIGDLLASGHNVFSGTWIEASVPSQIELTVLDWLRQLCGLPASASGLFTSGGSMANLTALAIARENSAPSNTCDTLLYCSDQTHSSIARAVRILGFQSDQLKKIPTDENFRIDIDALLARLGRDRATGKRPIALVANAGTTNTGAVDPLDELAAIAQQQGLWLHIDASYGGPALLTESGKRLLKGIANADSITLDPHKWLFQPFDCGCLLVKDVKLLEHTFSILPEYLRDVASSSDEVNFCDRGIELTRPFRALKLWLTLKTFGMTAISSAIDHGLRLALFAEARIRRSKHWEIVTPATLGIVTFRFTGIELEKESSVEFYRDLFRACLQDGTLMMSTTMLRDETVCRLCVINPRTTESDIEITIAKLEELAQRLVEHHRSRPVV